MRVFVTGATGWVGSAVVQDLIAHGHEVLGMTRSDAGVAALEAAGAKVHHGTLEDPDSLRRGAAEADGVIHTAFNHDFSKFAENGEVEKHAIAALGAELEGSNRPLVVTSGVALLQHNGLATEDDVPAGVGFPRDPETAVNAWSSRGVRTSIIRLSPTTHGHGDHGFVPILIALAREKGVAAYVGEGDNRWPAVHRLDAAPLYRLALEREVGGTYHAVAEEGVPFKAIAEVIGLRLNIPVVSLSPEEAAEHFGWFHMFAGIDVPTSSVKTRETLGWAPSQPELIPDLDHPAYFTA
ncbi:MAG: SDR family oxidoreductase [Caulobacteraceae bacterium]